MVQARGPQPPDRALHDVCASQNLLTGVRDCRLKDAARLLWFKMLHCFLATLPSDHRVRDGDRGTKRARCYSAERTFVNRAASADWPQVGPGGRDGRLDGERVRVVGAPPVEGMVARAGVGSPQRGWGECRGRWAAMGYRPGNPTLNFCPPCRGSPACMPRPQSRFASYILKICWPELFSLFYPPGLTKPPSPRHHNHPSAG